MGYEYVEIKNRKCFYCGRPEAVDAIHEHHVVKRSIDPSRIDDPTNKCPLCWRCHRRTELDYKFLKEIEKLWTISIQTKLPGN